MYCQSITFNCIVLERETPWAGSVFLAGSQDFSRETSEKCMTFIRASYYHFTAILNSQVS